MRRNQLSNIGLTVLRLILGFVFMAHGWQKFNEWTIAGTQASFRDMGVPLAGISAPAISVLELVGGIALMVGMFSRPIAALLALDMLGAILLVHLPEGIFVEDNGVELVLLLAGAATMIALTGPGKVSLDHVFFGTRTLKSTRLA